MEQYSKEFWRVSATLPTNYLQVTNTVVAKALLAHKDTILKWVDGGLIEVYGDSGWVSVPAARYRFSHTDDYRVAPPPNMERDVVVYWRGALRNQPFHMPACIDVRLLCPPGTNEKAKTLAQLEEETPGFKLLSITRVVIDPTNHNLLKYSTKLDNLARVPF